MTATATDCCLRVGSTTCNFACKHHAHLTILGVCGTATLVGGVVATTVLGAAIGVGYIVAGVATISLYVASQRLRRERRASARATQLEHNNIELTTRNTKLCDEMHDVACENNRLIDANEGLRRDVNMFKETIGLVGQTSDSFLEDLRQAWRSYKSENDRHANLVSHQARLHLWQMIQHFDTNSDLQLTDAELASSIAYLKVTYPAIDTEKLSVLSMQSAEEVLGLGPRVVI